MIIIRNSFVAIVATIIMLHKSVSISNFEVIS